MIDVSRSGKTLTINRRSITFDQRVDEAVVVGNRVIVELRVDDFAVGDPLVGRNILGFDENGEMLWRIPANGLTRPSRYGGETPEAYFGLWLTEDGILKTGIPSGWDFEIDPETGQPSNPEFTK